MISRYRSSRPGMTVAPPPRSETEDIAGTVERIGQRVDVVFVVVQVEAGPGGGVDAETAHQWLGAVMTGAQADVALVEHLRQVVRVDVAESEAERRSANLDVGRAVKADVVAVPTDERVHRVRGDVHLMATNVGHPEIFEEVDRGVQPDRLGDRWRTGLELGRQLGRGETVETNVEDHVAATEERWHRLEQCLAAPQHTDARRPDHLVAAERDEVG